MRNIYAVKPTLLGLLLYSLAGFRGQSCSDIDLQLCSQLAGRASWAILIDAIPTVLSGTIEKHSVEVTNCFSVPHNESEDEVRYCLMISNCIVILYQNASWEYMLAILMYHTTYDKLFLWMELGKQPCRFCNYRLLWTWSSPRTCTSSTRGCRPARSSLDGKKRLFLPTKLWRRSNTCCFIPMFEHIGFMIHP